MSLQDAKKFYLVDSSNINNILSRHESAERLKPIQKKELSRLDTLMSSVLNDSKLSDVEKVLEYNRVLTEFQEVATTKPKIAKETPQATASDTNITQNGDSDNLGNYNYLLGVIKQYNKKADNLMSLLTKSKQLKLSDRGEVIIKGKKIPNSNITDLLNRAVNSRPPKLKTHITPGWEEFHTLLREQNIPQSLLYKKIESPNKTTKVRKPVSYHIKQLDKWSPYDSTKNAKKRKRSN